MHLASPPSNKRKVAEMLDEKRRREQRPKQMQEQRQDDQSKSSLIMMVSQPVVLHGIAAPIISTPDKRTTAKGTDTLGVSKTKRKRTRKPKADPKGKFPGNISQMPFTPQSPISWILTPNGLLAVTGLGVPVVPQVPPAGKRISVIKRVSLSKTTTKTR